MPKIDNDILDPDTEKYMKYCHIISLLQDVKLVHGGEGLIRTLQRHSRLRQFLIDYQKTAIIDLEGNL